MYHGKSNGRNEHSRRNVLRRATVATGVVGLGTFATGLSTAASYKELDVEGGYSDAEYEIVVFTGGVKCYETSNVESSQRNGETGLSEGVYNEKSGQDYSMLTGHADDDDHDTYLIPENAEVYKVRIDGVGTVTVDPPYNDAQYGSIIFEGTTSGCCNTYSAWFSRDYQTEGCGDSVTGNGELESDDYAGYGYVSGEIARPYKDTDSDCYRAAGGITEVSMSGKKGGVIKCTYDT